MHARILTTQAKVDKIDELITVFRASIVPAAMQQKGFIGIKLFIDRATARESLSRAGKARPICWRARPAATTRSKLPRSCHFSPQRRSAQSMKLLSKAAREM